MNVDLLKHFKLNNIINYLNNVIQNLNKTFGEKASDTVDNVTPLIELLGEEINSDSNFEYSGISHIKQSLLSINWHIIKAFYAKINDSDPKYFLEEPIFSCTTKDNQVSEYINKFYIYLRNSYDIIDTIIKETREVVPITKNYTIKYQDIIRSDPVSYTHLTLPTTERV